MTAAALQQVNLYNPSLRPSRERLSARQLVVWAAIAALGLGAVAWWASRERLSLQQEMAQQAAARSARAPGNSAPSPQQIAALERSLKDAQARLDNRKATLEMLQRGLAGPDRGPSALMGFIADTIPPTAWVTDVRAAGGRLDVSGRALDASAVDTWLESLRASGRLAQSPQPVVRVERTDPPARSLYLFSISAALAAPLADDEARP